MSARRHKSDASIIIDTNGKTLRKCHLYPAKGMPPRKTCKVKLMHCIKKKKCPRIDKSDKRNIHSIDYCSLQFF